jgi:hypothetical protein
MAWWTTTLNPNTSANSPSFPSAPQCCPSDALPPQNRKSSTLEGAPIPANVADKLQGREFSSFNAFRRAFWKAVANEQLLMDQFTQLNKIDMRDGFSPSAIPSEQVGGTEKV